MTSFTKAIYHSKSQIAQFITDDNRVLLRSGGSLPWRIFNCGDLSSPMEGGKPTPRVTKNFIGFANPENSEHHFFIFPNYETGRAELRASLRRRHNKKTIAEMVKSYAPSGDRNNTEKYINDLCADSGIDKNTRLMDLSDKQLESVMDGIEKLEGYHHNKETRKEVWRAITQIQASDGKQPVEGEEIILRSAGKETSYKSNAAGLFPPIVHGTEPAELHHKTADGNLKKLADLSPDKGQRFTLSSKIAEFFGMTATTKSPENPVTNKEGLLYEVKPNDTLGKIAARFKRLDVTVQRIKQDNQLKTDTIYPGQILGINMPPPSAMPAQEAKKAPPPLPKRESQNGSASTMPPKTTSARNAPAQTTATTSAPVSTTLSNTTSARSKDGKGEPLALIKQEDGTVPWMKYAIAEAKRWNGKREAEIEKTINYHKQIKDGTVTMVGTLNAWCAAFANWCLMSAGYPIKNPQEAGYIDPADMGRASGFRQVSVKDKDQGPVKFDAKGKPIKSKTKTHLEPNPLYFKIETPVYGAIAVVTSPSGHGHHVGFVYGRSGKNKICILGGNQDDAICFAPTIEKDPATTKIKVNKNGEEIETKSKGDHLEFYLPISYSKTYENNPKILEDVDADKLNKEIGFVHSKAGTPLSTR